LKEIQKESFSAHKAICETRGSESYNPNSYQMLNSDANQAEKNLKLKDDFGIESVKSLRERLDKKLKAISETMDSISKKDLTRGLSTNRDRDRDRDRLDFSSLEKIQELKNKYNINNNSNILTTIDNEFENLPNFNTNETKNLQEDNFKNENYKGKPSLNLNLIKEPREYGAEDYKHKLNFYTSNSHSPSNNNHKLQVKNKVEEDIGTKSKKDSSEDNNNDELSGKINNIVKESIFNNNETKISNNLDFMASKNTLPEKNENANYEDNGNFINKKEYVATESNIANRENLELNELLVKHNSDNEEELINKLDFSNNISSGIKLNSRNDDNNDAIRNYDIEENFNPNEGKIKNLINFEISKISHNNFNDENDPISDNEAENFDIKRKKYHNNYNNIAEDEAVEHSEIRKNYINIRKY